MEQKSQPGDLEQALAKPVSYDGEYRPFGGLAAADARKLGDELRAAGSWGPMSRVAGVAQAWGELAEEIEAADGERVRDLDPKRVVAFARRLWILPPPGGFL
jgi:hypothetical protein